ncbi:MAG: FAD-dependent monooxygenase [Erythrobacter sp.]|nr:MAG: FAD-dependent monooxygenase [Erythrobacter sp.]
MDSPLILGAGPAGCAAAIVLANNGAQPLLLDRDEAVGDPLCGGFLSWRTLEQLQALGIDALKLGAHRVSHLRLFDGERDVVLPLPHAAVGLSRHALDTALREVALARGAMIAFDRIGGLTNGVAQGQSQKWRSDSIFLATGKHDLRGHSRPRHAKDTTLGLRLRLPASPERTALLGGAIELHLFKGGYAGIVLQDGGSANVCLALRKSALARSGSSPEALFGWLAAQSPALAARLEDDWRTIRSDTIGAVPYGWIGSETTTGLFRLGDQAAVIPSLAGEGISIALASGSMAARYWLEGGASAAPKYQRAFAIKARKPIRLASLAWHLAETRLGARAALALARIAPAVVAQFAEMARIAPAPSLAPR